VLAPPSATADAATKPGYELEDLDDLFLPNSQGAPLAEVWEVIPDPKGVYFGTSPNVS